MISLSSLDMKRFQSVHETAHSPLAFDGLTDWRKALHSRLMDLVQAERGWFVLQAPSVLEPTYSDVYTNAFFNEYSTHYHIMDPVSKLIEADRLKVYSTSLIAEYSSKHLGMDMGWYYRSPIYNDFYKPNQIEDCIGIVVSVESPIRKLEQADSTRLIMNGCRVVWSAHSELYPYELFGEKGSFFMEMIRSSIRQSLEIYLATALPPVALLQSLDLLSEPAWLCGRNGAVLYQNAAVNQVMQNGHVKERFTAALRRAIYLFQRASTENRRGEVPEQVNLPVVRAENGAYRLRGSFLSTLGCESSSDPWLLLMGVPISHVEMAEEYLVDIMGLTRQEVRVAKMLAERKRNREIAEALSISPNTARRHTENVFAKLGIHSRDEVSRILNGF